MDLSNTVHFLKVKDHSVSHETFDLLYDASTDMLITTPQPELKDLSKYYNSEDYISHTDSSKSLFDKTYQLIKKIALKNKLNLINIKHPNKGNLLDIGAGTGDFLTLAQKNGWQTLGIETSTKAKNIAIQKNVKFVESTQLLDNHSCDVVTLWHVLEHLPNLDFQIKELKRILKPNGTLIIAVPNYKSYDAQHYKQFWAAYDVPIHFWHFSKKTIHLLFDKINMKVIAIKPMYFDSFYVSLLSEKYKSNQMNPFKAFFIGLYSNIKAMKDCNFSSLIYIIQNNNETL
jgi:2-polyprenyl-3-methyl-5-hydroxy-6-metoxy-1,4-benzoquinol methylase